MTTVSIDSIRTGKSTPQPDSALSFERTVDRRLVHRDSLGEVFVTDLQPAVAPGGYIAAAQLPRSHAYYGDHLLRPNTYDPILLLEAARQAALAGAHEFFGVPQDHKFILTHLRIHLAHPELTTVGDSVFAVRMDIQTGNVKLRDGRATGLDYEIRLSVDGVMIGQASVGLRFKSPESYLRLRTSNRNGRALPSSASPCPRLRGPSSPLPLSDGPPLRTSSCSTRTRRGTSRRPRCTSPAGTRACSTTRRTTSRAWCSRKRRDSSPCSLLWTCVGSPPQGRS